MKDKVSKRWTKLKKNILAFARMKIMNDDLRLWGSNINVVGLNPKDYEHIKRLMAQNQIDHSNINQKKKRWLLYPDDTFISVWTVIYFILLIYTAFVTPYRLAFIDDVSIAMNVIEWMVDSLFLMDIFITMFSAIQLDTGRFMDDRKKIVTKYLKGWFFIDVIAIFPFQILFEDGDTA